VEGEAEKFLLPALARLFDEEIDFDSVGISVCAIGGTNSAPYVRLLGPKGLDIPFAVLTDFDPKDAATSQEDADPEDDAVDSYGENRVVNQIMREILPRAEWNKLTFKGVLQRAEASGVFLNTFTFEVDLFQAGNEDKFAKAVKGLTNNKRMRARFNRLAADPQALDAGQFLKDIDSIGKGRLAQRLAAIFLEDGIDVSPPYITAALNYMKARLA